MFEIALKIYKGNEVEAIHSIRPHVFPIQVLIDQNVTDSVKIKRMVRNNEVMVLM